MESDIVCEGYLTKAPPLDQPRSKWCYRYFTLHKSDLVLKYYKDKEAWLKISGKKEKGDSGKPRGEIQLTTVNRINDTSDHALANHYRHGFELETNTRLWILIANDQEDMDKWLMCLSKILGQSKRQNIVGSPNPAGSPKRSKSILKKIGKSVGKSVPLPSSSSTKKFEPIAEDSSSSSHGDDFDISAFDEDEEEAIASSKSVSSQMSSNDSAIGLGSEKCNKVRLTDNLPKADQPLLDEVSQREWMLRMNQRNTSSEKVSIPMTPTTNSSDTLLPSSNFILRNQITSPTMGRGNGPLCFDDGELEDEKTPVYDSVQESPFVDDNSGQDPTYDVPAVTNVIPSSARKVETVTKSCSSPDEDLYDIPSNVIKSLPINKSLPPRRDRVTDSTNSEVDVPEESVYDVPSQRGNSQKTQNVTEVDGNESTEADLPDPIYDTPPPKLGPSTKHRGRQNSGASSSSETSFVRTTTMSIGRQDSIGSAYQMLVIDEKTKNGTKVAIINEDDATYCTPPNDEIYNTPPSRPPPQPTRETPPPPQSEEMIYNVPPARNTPPRPPQSGVSPSSSGPRTPTHPGLETSMSDPLPPPSRSPPKPFLPPRTDRPPVPSRVQTLGRPSRHTPEETKPTRPQSETMCPPSRPVPRPPPDARESHLVEIVPGEQTGTVSSTTLTRAKINQREQGGGGMERSPAPDNEYLELRPTPIISPRDTVDRPLPPPIVPRGPNRASTQPSLPVSHSISSGIGLSTVTAAVGAPSTPPRIPQRAATVAGQHHNPFLEGFTPPKETATLARHPQPRTMYTGIGAHRGATLPPPASRAATLPPKPSHLNFSKKAQDEFDAIPDDSPTPERPTKDSLHPGVANMTTVTGTGKYPTIKTNKIGMVKVKPGYQNVTEVKGALKSRGDSVKGERHGKLNRRPVPEPGYTPMSTMEERMKQAAHNEKQGYEPMLSHEQRMALAQNQMSQQAPRPVPPRTLAMSGIHSPATTAAPSPVYVDTVGSAPSPIYVESGRLQAEIMADISRQPEFMRLGEIDMTLREFMPMTSGDGSQYQDEYLDMESLVAGGYEHRQPHDDYLAMAPQAHDDYLAMDHQPHDDYLAMAPQAHEDYLAMAPKPHEDYLAMAPQTHEDYLAMAPQTQHQPHDDYLSMGAAANVPDQYSNLTFSDS
ncbi:hypothetical protein ACHWQZ_G001558 [Mnemiopsis leidyi]